VQQKRKNRKIIKRISSGKIEERRTMVFQKMGKGKGKRKFRTSRVISK